MSTTQGQSSVNFEETVKDFVATRPRRPHRGRIVAGVAAGIGRRYGIDPIIVRVALVVSAFYGGAGIIFYLLGWLFFPGESDEVSAFEGMLNRGRSSTSTALTVVLCLCLIPSGHFVFGTYFSTVAGAAVLLGGLFLLHRYRADQGRIDGSPTSPGATMTDAAPTSTTPVEDARPRDRTAQDQSQDQPTAVRDRTPPVWDPLGAAPFAWDLPDPGPARPTNPVPVSAPQRRRRSRIGLATFGLTLVVGAALVVLAPAGGWLSVPHIVGILGAVVGVGLVAGSFVRGGRGLIPLAVLLSAAGFLLTSAHYTSWHGAGDADYTPGSISDVQPLYQRSVGDLRLDLTELPNTGTVHTTVKLGVGDATVEVPEGANVVATCSSSIGDVDCLDQRDSGPGSPTVHATQNSGTTTGPHIVLNVQSGPGDVRVISEPGSVPLAPAPPR